MPAARDRDPLGAPRRHDAGTLRLAARVAALDRVVLEPRAAEDRGAGLEVESHERPQLDGLRQVGAGGDANRAAARAVAGVDRALEGRGVICFCMVNQTGRGEMPARMGHWLN